VLVRFGRWEDVLRQPEFAPQLKSSNAVRHYARGVSLAALDRLDEAERELRALEAAIAAMDDRPIGNNPARLVLGVPHHMLAGELLFRRGKVDEGLARLEEAVKLQDTLLYDEPPDWMTPARHPLAASLMAAGRAADAEAVLRADLRQFPENGWALVGLARSLKAQGKAAEAEAAQRRFEAAWARADVPISSPCLCQPGG